MKRLALSCAVLALMSPPAFAQNHRDFAFGTDAKLPAGAVRVDSAYDAARGYGFEGDAPMLTAARAGGKPFFFCFDAPEGNYRVTVTLGGDAVSDTTVKAELRRLMLETVKVPAGGKTTQSFIVNVRTPVMSDGTSVKLKAPREVETEARAWDSRITLEFDGAPAVREITVEPVTVPTIYLLGDSTVCDQSGEPYASWGQMLPRFFKPVVAVANHGESGESVSASISRGRFDKILSLIKPGDVFIVQFGHNDMKEKAKDPDAAQKYRAGLIDWAQKIKAKGATAVIVTPMNRHSFENGGVVNSLEEYPQMAREAAAASGAVLIDLNAESKVLYEALGDKPSLALFEHTADYAKVDMTHHSPYGAYELAKIIIEGLRKNHLKVADALVDGLPHFDPAHPDPESSFKVPPSVTFAAVKPLGS